MQSNNAFNGRNFITVLCFGLLIALLAFSISLWLTPRYKSTVKLLAINTDANIDTITASKTANYITGILGEVIYSNSFISSIFSAEPNLIDNLGTNSEQRQKQWGKIVKTTIQDNTGIIIVDVYGSDRYQTALLATVIGNTIIQTHGQYDGSQNRINIKMIDTPSIYEDWSIMQIARDSGLGFLAGLLFGFTLIMVFPSHRLFDFKRRQAKQHVQRFNYSVPDQRPQVKRTAPEERPVIEPATEDEDIIDYTQKFSNPWLDEYYEENLPERSRHEN